MAQRKSERIVINVEPQIAAAYKLLLNNEGIGPSEYGRKMIIEELKNCGLLTDEIIAKMMT